MSLNLAFIPTSKRRAGGKRKPVGLLSPSTLGSPASCTSASTEAKVPQLAGGRAAAQGGRPPGSPCLRFFGVLPYWAAVSGKGRRLYGIVGVLELSVPPQQGVEAGEKVVEAEWRRGTEIR